MVDDEYRESCTIPVMENYECICYYVIPTFVSRPCKLIKEKQVHHIQLYADSTTHPPQEKQVVKMKIN